MYASRCSDWRYFSAVPTDVLLIVFSQSENVESNRSDSWPASQSRRISTYASRLLMFWGPVCSLRFLRRAWSGSITPDVTIFERPVLGVDVAPSLAG